MTNLKIQQAVPRVSAYAALHVTFISYCSNEEMIPETSKVFFTRIQ
jgi:hypothetical protein